MYHLFVDFLAKFTFKKKLLKIGKLQMYFNLILKHVACVSNTSII